MLYPVPHVEDQVCGSWWLRFEVERYVHIGWISVFWGGGIHNQRELCMAFLFFLKRGVYT